MRAVGYARVSTVEQATEGMSLDAQESRIRAWAETTGANIAEIVRDEGVSGTKVLSERSGGRRIAALLDTRRPEVDAVVVVRMDRLGRDAAEQLALLKRFRTGKVGLVAIAQQIDLATPHGRAMAQIGAVFAELERSLIAERTVEALTELRRQGRVWNHPPFGWDAINGNLVANAVEQDSLARIRQLRAAGVSYHNVAAALDAEGRSTKRGGHWQAASVRSVLRTETLTSRSAVPPHNSHHASRHS
jgi:site-specific DNA recombinase